jgi:hypothetical protein
MAVAVVAAAVVLGSCTQGSVTRLAPTCRNVDTLVLEAQSVPTADLVPCITLFPAGWKIGTMEINSSLSQFSLTNDRAGDRAVVVSFLPRCNVSGATEIASDEDGTRRYEKVESVTPGYSGVRYYTFRGGCVDYRFRLGHEGRALLNEASLALTFVRRTTVAEDLRRHSDGRLHL